MECNMFCVWWGPFPLCLYSSFGQYGQAPTEILRKDYQQPLLGGRSCNVYLWSLVVVWFYTVPSKSIRRTIILNIPVYSGIGNLTFVLPKDLLDSRGDSHGKNFRWPNRGEGCGFLGCLTLWLLDSLSELHSLGHVFDNSKVHLKTHSFQSLLKSASTKVLLYIYIYIVETLHEWKFSRSRL